MNHSVPFFQRYSLLIVYFFVVRHRSWEGRLSCDFAVTCGLDCHTLDVVQTQIEQDGNKFLAFHSLSPINSSACAIFNYILPHFIQDEKWFSRNRLSLCLSASNLNFHST